MLAAGGIAEMVGMLHWVRERTKSSTASCSLTGSRHEPLGLAEGLTVPDYATCVRISTDASSQTQHVAGRHVVGRRLGGGRLESVGPDSVALDDDVSTRDVMPVPADSVASVVLTGIMKSMHK